VTKLSTLGCQEVVFSISAGFLPTEGISFDFQTEKESPATYFDSGGSRVSKHVGNFSFVALDSAPPSLLVEVTDLHVAFPPWDALLVSSFDSSVPQDDSSFAAASVVALAAWPLLVAFVSFYFVRRRNRNRKNSLLLQVPAGIYFPVMARLLRA